MKLSAFCATSLIEMDLKSDNSDDVITEIADILAKSDRIQSKEEVEKALKEREKLASTGLGFGVALPHARSKGAKGLTIAFGRSESGIDFGALDQEPVHLFFAIVVPETAVNTHLTALGKLTYLLKEKKNRQILMEATYPQEILDFIDTD